MRDFTGRRFALAAMIVVPSGARSGDNALHVGLFMQ